MSPHTPPLPRVGEGRGELDVQYQNLFHAVENCGSVEVTNVVKKVSNNNFILLFKRE